MLEKRESRRSWDLNLEHKGLFESKQRAYFPNVREKVVLFLPSPSLMKLGIFLSTNNHALGKNYNLHILPEILENQQEQRQLEEPLRQTLTLPKPTIMNNNILKILSWNVRSTYHLLFHDH